MRRQCVNNVLNVDNVDKLDNSFLNKEEEQMLDVDDTAFVDENFFIYVAYIFYVVYYTTFCYVST